MRAANTGPGEGKESIVADYPDDNTGPDEGKENTLVCTARMRAANTGPDEGRENIVLDRPDEGSKYRPR